MNKVFVSGSVGANPQVSYTPKGQKILSFSMFIEDGGFSIDVIFAGDQRVSEAAAKTGKRVLVAGALAKMKAPSRSALTVKASKILPMEE